MCSNKNGWNRTLDDDAVLSSEASKIASILDDEGSACEDTLGELLIYICQIWPIHMLEEAPVCSKIITSTLLFHLITVPKIISGQEWRG